MIIEDTPVKEIQEENKVIQCDLDESVSVLPPPAPTSAARREKGSKSKSKRQGGARGKKRLSSELEDVRNLSAFH